MRGKPAPKRKIEPDAKYANPLVTKLINHVMRKGKKSTAKEVVYTAFAIIEKNTKQSPVEVFDAAMKNVGPAMEVRSRRVGGANYQIPIPVRGERRVALTFRWILEAAKSKKGKPMAERLAQELIDAAKNTGEAVKKKMNVHRMAEANRAFAHFAR